MKSAFLKPRVLVIDVGGTHVKLKATGPTELRKHASGPDLGPQDLVDIVSRMTSDWEYDVASIGYPGAVLGGRPVCEPRNLADGWVGFDLEGALGKPIKLVNDAAMQALGSYEGGRMLFLGLGTGLGTAIISDGRIEPLELAHLPYRKGKTYEDCVGKRGFKRLGKKKWRKAVHDVVGRLKQALQVDYVMIGGGRARKLSELPPHSRLGDNGNAFLGGLRLWEDSSAPPPPTRLRCGRPTGCGDTAETEALKEVAGRRLAEYVEDGMSVGLGTGSTVRHTLLALAERRPNIRCFATSERTHRLATSLGLTVLPLEELSRLDLALDGADEVDFQLNLMKGGGGAHTREKIVAAMAERFLVAVDESKLVERLGAFPLSLEVLPFAREAVAGWVRELGAESVGGGAERSDVGNVLLDARFRVICDPPALAARLAAIPGLVEHGLFPGGMVERVVVSSSSGLREIVRHDHAAWKE